MSHRAPLVWLLTPSPKTFTWRKLLQFVRAGRGRKRILVLQAGDIAPDMQRWLKLAQRFGLLKTVSLKLETQHYSEQDFALVGETRAQARCALGAVLPAVLGATVHGLSPDEIEDILRGLEIQLGDRIYARVRMLLQVLNAAGIAPSEPWDEYGRWLCDALEQDQGSRARQTRDSPLSYNFVRDTPMPETLPDAVLGFAPTRDLVPTTLVLSVSSREAYLASAASIVEAEYQLGRTALAVLQTRNAKENETLEKANTAVSPLMIFDSGSRDFNLTKSRFKVTPKAPAPNDRLYATFDENMDLASTIAGLHRQTCLRLVANETLTNLNRVLPQVLTLYMRIMRNTQFDGVDTLVCSPSRMAHYVPIFEGMKRRGVYTIEYQALFWSAHPRYEVRDVDLFVCSDRATMQVIEAKYQQGNHSTDLVLGPAFSMAEFQKQYAAVTQSQQAPTEDDLIGLALQPGYDDVFLRACEMIRAQGKRILIRPHPAQPIDEVQARYAGFGEIDQGALEVFMARSAVIVTGFSNVAFQAAIVGKPSICLPIPNQLGIDLSQASECIHICADFDALPALLSRDLSLDASAVLADPIAQWCDIRASAER